MIQIHPHIREHFMYYLTLALLQLLGFVLVYLAAPDVSLQMDVVIINSCLYVLIASLHHHMHHDLHPKIVAEYVLVSFLGICMTFFLLRMQ